MAAKAPKGWYDITVPLKQGIIYFPTDPLPPKIYRLHDRALGAKVTMSVLEIISHTGTHIDAPLHFIADAETITDMPLDATVGPARVIAIKDKESIKAAELKKHNIKKGERVLFKTRNSPSGYAGEKFDEDYCYLEDDGADYLVERGVKLVGIDFITIGTIKRMENITHTHEALLSAGIYILEDCALDGVPPGEYEMLCLPLPIYKGDAAPCRAILRPLK
jgi:arylformamidase